MRRVTLLVFTACVGNVGGEIADSGGGQPDAAVPDSGVHDAGVPDSGAPDAGTHDAGIPDSGVPDSGTPDAGPAACTAAFCDDFESYDGGVPKGPWSLSLNGGSVVMDNTKAHSGARSVHVSTPGGSTGYYQAYIGMGAPFFPQTEYYGRVWFWLKATPTQTTHWTNISGEGDVLDAGSGVRAYVRFGGQYSPTLMANYDSSGGPQSDCWDHSTSAMPAQQWACFEWHYRQATNEMELWVDGGSVMTVTQTGMGCINHDLGDKWLLPVFDTLRLGWEHYQPSDPIDLWLDDVALDTQRVGCP